MNCFMSSLYIYFIFNKQSNAQAKLRALTIFAK